VILILAHDLDAADPRANTAAKTESKSRELHSFCGLASQTQCTLRCRTVEMQGDKTIHRWASRWNESFTRAGIQSAIASHAIWNKWAPFAGVLGRAVRL